MHYINNDKASKASRKRLDVNGYVVVATVPKAKAKRLFAKAATYHGCKPYGTWSDGSVDVAIKAKPFAKANEVITQKWHDNWQKRIAEA